MVIVSVDGVTSDVMMISVYNVNNADVMSNECGNSNCIQW